MMAHSSDKWPFCSLYLLLLALSIAQAHSLFKNENKIKSAVFLSPKFVLGPGSVVNEFHHIDFPRGHIGLKSFDAEVVDEAGHPVPLHETYLHHWIIVPYHARKGLELSEHDAEKILKYSSESSDYVLIRNSGLCQRNVLGQYFGLGSETRKTSTRVPDPYGIEVGNPEEIPDGYELKWLLNIHAIDTRGVEDRLGCTECRCNLYNLTADEYGRPIMEDYKGGLLCCYDKTQCRVRKGFEGIKRRSLYLRYTVKWVDWDTSVLPVKIYIFDVTDTWKKSNVSTGLNAEHHCKVEYEVKSCSSNGMNVDDRCLDAKRISLDMPFSGYLVYGVAHQHAGGIGSALYRENGEVICSSIPTYGKGKEPGDEADYIVGMSTCYPQPGSVTINNGDALILESNYSSTRDHTGVMGLFLILVAEQLPKPENSWHAFIQMQEKPMNFSSAFWLPAGVLGAALSVVAGLLYLRRNKEEDGYQSLSI